MCTAFSTLQFLNRGKRDDQVVAQEYRKAVQHFKFCVSLYKLQVHAGRYFLHEHPARATSWAEPCIRQLCQMDGVVRVVGDMCMQGMCSPKGLPVRKSTGWLSNAPFVLNELRTRCDQAHTHDVLLNGKAKAAAIFPIPLCKSILRGIRKQLTHDGHMSLHHVGIEVEEEDHQEWAHEYGA